MREEERTDPEIVPTKRNKHAGILGTKQDNCPLSLGDKEGTEFVNILRVG